MEQVARMVYVPQDIDRELVGLSEGAQVPTTTIILECVRLAFRENIVRGELLKRLEAIRQEEWDRTFAEAQAAIERATASRQRWDTPPN